MLAGAEIAFDSGGSNDFCHLASGDAASSFHLPEAILGVYEALQVDGVFNGGSFDVRDAVLVSGDCGGLGNCERKLPRSLGHGSPDEPVSQAYCGNQKDCGQGIGIFEDASHLIKV